MKYKILSIIIIISALFVYYFKKNTNSNQLTIAIIQGASHVAVDKANINFKNKLTELLKNKEIVFKSYNAQGSASNAYNLAKQLSVDDTIDLFFTIDTSTTLAVSSCIKNKPIVFMAVENPNELGLLNEKSLLAGITDSISEDIALDMILKLAPKAKTIGLLYKNETSKRIIFDKIKLLLEKNGYNFVDMAILDESELLASLLNHIDKIDVLFSSTDNLVASSLSIITQISNKHKKPFFVCLQNGAEKGAFVSVGMKYEDNGFDCAEIAALILDKKIKPFDIPLRFGSYDEWYFNQDTADIIGVEIPNEIDDIKINII
jgi:putative ABC transport system substrate-binding protein